MRLLRGWIFTGGYGTEKRCSKSERKIIMTLEDPDLDRLYEMGWRAQAFFGESC
ncbi:MAG: hypothetical protein ACLU4N_13215 [Butyricimonas faecihominis]